MTRIPDSLINSLRKVESFNESAFKQVHESGEQVTSIRFNPSKVENPDEFLSKWLSADEWHSSSSIPWCNDGFYLRQRPSFTLDPYFHAGYYYVQEASGMFLESALSETLHKNVESGPLKILDLCAAPGGKSTLIQSMISKGSMISKDSLLVSNEVIKSRATVLEENVTRWGSANTLITNNDPKDFSSLIGFFDVIVIDAPCSGSGLFRRDPEAVAHWSEANVELCHQRQERILADIFPALKTGGILIYSTCSYSKEEDEDIADWIIEHFEVEKLRLEVEGDELGIVESISDKHGAYGYRFWPDRLLGEGFFISCFKKTGDQESSKRNPKKNLLEKITRNEESFIHPWINDPAEFDFFRFGDQVLAIPSGIVSMVQPVLGAGLYIRQLGLRMGKRAGNELIPDPALAFSPAISKRIVAVSLKQEQALQYLRREEVSINDNHRGWALVEYEGAKLGWVKILQNRVNNYYPKEWRIRMK